MMKKEDSLSSIYDHSKNHKREIYEWEVENEENRLRDQVHYQWLTDEFEKVSSSI